MREEFSRSVKTPRDYLGEHFKKKTKKKRKGPYLAIYRADEERRREIMEWYEKTRKRAA